MSAGLRAAADAATAALHATAAARDEPVKNAKINFPEVLVISESGESLGVKTVPEAMALFDAKEMDLVLVSTSQMPPVCRIVSKKAAYEKKKNEVRKRPNASVVKELEINSTITDHDLEIKLNKATELLEKGYRLQVTVFERGNKNSPVVIKKIIASLQSHGSVAGMPDVSGKKIIVNFESKTKK
ncbi:hypothetical protein HK105_202362 [Polyrhizophydium stewartii]|uniref:Translation initiation factor IF-3 n=1 Tax=Polyrhizophydium stewartii TaxID=2732419 RepID=A0ABR4NEK6_9FUNG|nr:hypothetical protein HK105_007418 [Polyrhizophydium stewartii]